MKTDTLLEQGIAALRAGQKAGARQLLLQVVEQDERNEMGWLWLSGAVDTEEERRICIENVLAINPKNSIARLAWQKSLVSRGIRMPEPELPALDRHEPSVRVGTTVQATRAQIVAPRQRVKAYRAWFVKRNGERRRMLFVKLRDLPAGFLNRKLKGTGRQHSLSPGHELVWDVEAHDFRTFNWNTQFGEIEQLEVQHADL